jgi:hypothetical protein
MFLDRPAGQHIESATRRTIQNIEIELKKNANVTIDHAVATWIPNYDMRILNQSIPVTRAYYFSIYSLDLATIDLIAQQSGLTEKVCLADTRIEVRVAADDPLITHANRC